MATFSHCRTCDTVDLAGSFDFTIERDPYCTGDSPDEIHYRCGCGSDDVEWDVIPCDSCEEAMPVEGFDDCAACILLDRYTHTKGYDQTDAEYARESCTEAQLVAIDEQIARTIDRGRA